MRTIKLMIAAIAAIEILSAAASFAAVEIKNEDDANYVDFKQVEAKFLLPRGFVRSTRFDGFEAKGRNIEVVLSLIKTPFSSIDDSINEELLRSRGVRLLNQTEVSINGRRGFLIKAVHEDGGKKWGKWLLALDNDGATLVANGVFTSGDTAAAEDVAKLIKSVVPYGSASKR